MFRLMVMLTFLIAALNTGAKVTEQANAMVIPKTEQSTTHDNNIRLQYLIPESVESALLINNVPQFYKKWNDSPLNKMWQNKKIRKRFAETVRELEQPRWELYSQRMFGLSIKELIALFPGQMLISFPRFSDQASLNLMANIGTNQDKIKQALSKQFDYQLKQLGEGEQYLQENEEFLGSRINSRYFLNEEKKREHFSWSLINNHLLLSASKQHLQNLIATFKDNQLADSWAESVAFENVTSATPEYDWILYFNASPFMTLVEQQVQPYQEIVGEDYQQVMDLINKTGIQSAYLLGKSQSDKIQMDVTVFHQNSSWLMGLFKHQSTALKWPEFLSQNALSASTSSVNIGQLWKNILNLPEKSPLFAQIIPMLQMQLQTYSQSSGVNLENALRDGFGREVYYAEYPLASSNLTPSTNDDNASQQEELESSHLLVLSLQDQQSVEMAINGLQKAFFINDLFKKKQFLDTAIYYYNYSGEQNIHQASDLVVYAITDGLLFYSNQLSTMENAIERFRHKKSESALASLASIQQVMDTLPEQAIDVSYYQGDYFAQGLVTLLGMFQEMTIESQQQYGCGNNKNTYIQTDDQTEDELQTYKGYFKSVLTSQHQADNFIRIHSHINY